MDGDILCNSHSITLLSCNNSRSPGQKDEDGLRLTSTGFSKKRACSPRWSEEPALHHLQHHQHHACPPTERSLPLGYSNSHIPLLHNNNNNTSTLSITTTTTSTVNTNHTPWQRRVARHKVRGKKSTLRLEDKNSQNRKVTDYFPIRRSSRKSKAELKCEEKKHIDDLITNGIEEGMECGGGGDGAAPGAGDRGEGPGRVRHPGLPEGGVRGGVPRRPAPHPRRQEEGGGVRPEPRHRLLHVLLPVPRQDLLRGRHEGDGAHGPAAQPQQGGKLPDQAARHQQRAAPHPGGGAGHRRRRGAALRLRRPQQGVHRRAPLAQVLIARIGSTRNVRGGDPSFFLKGKANIGIPR